MKKRFLFLLLVLSALSVFPQNSEDVLSLPDSLVGRLKEHRKADLARAEALDAAIMFYYDEHRILEAHGYIIELLSLADDLKDNFWIAQSQYYKSLFELENNNFDVFLSYSDKALEQADMLQMTDQVRVLLGRIYLSKSGYFINMNLFPESQEAIQNGLNVLNGSNTKVETRLLNNLSVIYNEIGNYDDCIKTLKKAINGEKKCISYGNIASAYLGKECFDSALIYTDSALLVSNSLYDSLVAIHFRGITMVRMGHLDIAEQLYDECLSKTRLGHSYAYLNSLIYQNSASIAADNGNFKKALLLVEDGIQFSRYSRNDSRIVDCIKLKAQILSSMHEFEKSIICFLEYDSLRNVLLTNQNKDRVNAIIHENEVRIMQQQYDTETKLAEQRQLYTIIIAVLIVILTFVAVFFIIKIKKQNEMLLQQELELRNREITAKSIGKMQSNEMLNDIIEKLSEMEEHPEKNVLPSAIRDLKTLVDADAKKDFDLHFVQMHPDFYQKLLADFPKLTQYELRLCAFIKSNLSMKEIAAINGISADSVKTARKRLRKSLNLTGEDTSLLEFLSKY